jgi:hypothetical protein
MRLRKHCVWGMGPATRHARWILLSIVSITIGACSGEPSGPAKSDGEAWLRSGSVDERFARVAKHLRGFDVAMVETGYRYGELYWAGQDRNWDYAAYQAEKIRTAVRNGVERRPKRASSAQLLEGPLAGVEEAIMAKDSVLFTARFDALTATCNVCHEAEKVAFVHVRPPTVRSSPVVAPPIAVP